MRRRKGKLYFILCVLLIVAACASPPATSSPTQSPPAPLLTATPRSTATPEERALAPTAPAEPQPTQELVETMAVPSPTMSGEKIYADVVAVQVGGESGAYQFSVGVSSPDTGCEQFADWWEVISAGGELLYRRILLHSHVGEQPFTRSGGPLAIGAGDTVIVRAHMNTSGYGGAAMQGSPQAGFEAVELPPAFGADLETVEPLPQGCAF